MIRTAKQVTQDVMPREITESNTIRIHGVWKYVQTAENLFLNATEPWKGTVMEGAKNSTNAKAVKGVRTKQNAVSQQKAIAQWE